MISRIDLSQTHRGDLFVITPTEVTTTVRGGGLGRGAWVALITGPDEQYGVARQFLSKDNGNLSRSGMSGTVTFDLPAYSGSPELYEYAGVTVSSTRTARGFFVRRIGGQEVALVDRAEAMEMVKEMALELEWE